MITILLVILILMLIGASFVLSLLFGWRLNRASEPFLPLTVLNNPVMRTGTASASLSMGVQIGLTIVVLDLFPIYLDPAGELRLSPVITIPALALFGWPATLLGAAIAMVAGLLHQSPRR